MQPIIPMWLIYLAGIVDSVSAFLVWVGGLSAIFQIVGTPIYKGILADIGEKEEKIDKVKYNKKLITLAMIMWFVGFLVPPQKTIYTMMVGSQLTPNNIELVGDSMKSTMDYLFEKTEDMITEINRSKGN